ncbi:MULTISPECIES: L,D-transpeptidase [unclassified Pannonibacter]|uniref:L,D-transpeptidase n=1 Tax=unclassified Pannonibacter TaxID=2627228 RepID=UPI001647B4CD|nr:MULTISPECIES: L,D-transpeptidase [unclassified Pannonibacter]
MRPIAVIMRSLVLVAACGGLLGLATAAPVQARAERVAFASQGLAPGTIVIRNSERRLYLVLGEGQALAYPVAVGKKGKAWTGRTYVTGRYLRPAWIPPAVVKRDFPDMPDRIEGGAPNNPMGVAAMTLAGGEFAIHGTNRPGSIGRPVSYGCIRMHNEHIADLIQRVRENTPVIALP